MKNFKGYLYGILTSVTFGLIPLFTLPLMEMGMNYDSILFYRFSFATVALAIMLLVTGQSFRIVKADIPVLLFLGLLYTGSSLFLLLGYDYMGAGVATAIHFTYPVFVTLLMFLIFREKTPWITWVAILMAVSGVAVMSVKGSELTMSVKGLIIVVISAVCYGSYILTVNKSRVSEMNGRKLAFYVFLCSSSIFAVKAMLGDGIQPLTAEGLGLSPESGSGAMPVLRVYLNLVLLAVLPTVISNVTLVQAVRYIGGTLTSVLGAMEPVTAVLIGTLIFGEEFTVQDGVGAVLIITAVTIIILSSSIQRTFTDVFRKIRPRHA